MQSENDIIVIGAGIVGISAALELQRRGRRVLVIDRKGVASETSRGNAGAFAFPEILPLATPGIMLKAPKWLLDPLGPLSVPPAYAMKIAPWMLRFWRASRPDRFAAAVAAQASLMKFAKAALERQVVTVDGEKMMRREGQLHLYESQNAFKASLADWDLFRANGVEFRLLESREAIAEIQPGLSDRFTHAGFTPGWMNVWDPAEWTAHLAARFEAIGGMIEITDVKALMPREGAVTVQTGKGERRAAQVVVAAGAWSHHLARGLGDRLPLETERGYNTTLPAGAFDNLRMHVTFAEHGFVVSKIGDGIRVGGAVELGGLDLPPNYRRADILLSKAARFLPGLKTEGGTQWMGFRPSMPDSLPVIDRSPRCAQVVYAFGHGHLGLTQSAGTAELVAALISGESPPIPLAAFSARRF